MRSTTERPGGGGVNSLAAPPRPAASGASSDGAGSTAAARRMAGGESMATLNTIATTTAAVTAPSIKLKLLQQCMMDSVDDDSADRVLHNVVFNFLRKRRVSIIRKRGCSMRRWCQRKSWEAFSADLTERQFRRYFRMSRECFDLLCRAIKRNVGEGAFKSEEFLRELQFRRPNSVSEARMMGLVQGHSVYTGGIICGEVKLAITLRILAGGSYLDLGLIFGTGSTYPYAIFRHVIFQWICDDKLVNISGIDFCKDEDRMNAVARDFADGSQHLFSGCIGAVDGWIVKIRKPRKSDGVLNPKSFYSRKGFYGLSVQAIVDKKKCVLFRSIESRGAEHDSTAFKRTGLYQWLIDINWTAPPVRRDGSPEADLGSADSATPSRHPSTVPSRTARRSSRTARRLHPYAPPTLHAQHPIDAHSRGKIAKKLSSHYLGQFDVLSYYSRKLLHDHKYLAAPLHSYGGQKLCEYSKRKVDLLLMKKCK